MYRSFISIDGCSRRSDFRIGDLESRTTSEKKTSPFNADTPQECADRVRRQYPDASGATWGRHRFWMVVSGYSSDCWAEFGGPNIRTNLAAIDWLSCVFKGK